MDRKEEEEEEKNEMMKSLSSRLLMFGYFIICEFYLLKGKLGSLCYILSAKVILVKR